MIRNEPLRVRFDTFELDEAEARLKRDTAPIALAPKAFAVLCTLARHPGALVTKEALLDAVWGHRHVSESVLKTTISELRAALADDAKHPKYIETASRRGYRFIGGSQTGGTVAATSNVSAAPAAPSNLPVFIGREAALDKLRHCWRRAIAGERQLIWIAGEAGVGKTRLIDAFLAELDADVATLGQCVELFGTGEPYLPILEAMKELCRREPELIDIMRTVAPTWLVQMPWLINDAERAALHSQVAGAHPDRMVREMRELMDRFTAKRPLIFVLEDLHWSDLGTLRMMEHFARRPRQVRLMWIASFRLTQVIAEEHPLRELRQELQLHRLCEELLLEPFSEAEVGAYIQSRIASRVHGDPPPETFIRRIHQHTDGLPLFVANVMDSLLAQSAAEATGADRWFAGESLPVPDSLAGVLEKQISRLPADVRSVLEAASVCGVEFRAGIVADMLNRGEPWVNEQCDALDRRRFWLRHVDIVERRDGSFDNRYAFAHALYRHVFYKRLSVPQRVQLHRRAARALESSRAAGDVVMAAEFASHYDRGHQPMLALKCYAEAARSAFANFAPREAFDLTTTALQLLQRVPQGEERNDVELQISHTRGIAAAQLYGIGASETFSAVDRARELCDLLPESPSRALLLNGIGFSRYMQGDYPAALALAARVEATAERYSDPALLVVAFLLRGLVLSMQADHVASRATLEKGLAIVEAAGARVPVSAFLVDPAVAFRVYLTVALMNLGLPDQARAYMIAARARARQTGQPTSHLLSLWLEGVIELRSGNVQRLAELTSELRTVVETHMLTQGEGPVRWLQGSVLARTGSPRAGFELIREGHELQTRLGMYAGKTEVLAQAAEALILDNDWHGAQRQLDEALELADRLQEHMERTSLHLLCARVARGMNDPAREMECIAHALDDARARGLTYHELAALVALIETGKAQDIHRLRCRQLYAGLTEGLDMPIPRRAAQLI